MQAEAFEAVVRAQAPGQATCHAVEPALLERAREGGGAELAAAVAEAMTRVARRGASVVVCTCSSLGAEAEDMDTGGRFVAQRIDRAMADEATGGADRLLLVGALASALEPVRALLLDSAARQGRAVAVRTCLVEGAWRHFEAGALHAYHRCVAEGIEREAGDAAGIVLAQASLAPVAVLTPTNVPIWSSPEPGVRAALAALTRR